MPRRHHFKSRDRLMGGAAALCALVLVGSLSYWLLTGHPWLDCVYMTVITITTVGFGEIIDLSQVPLGRVLTMFIALCGVGILAYMLSLLTAVSFLDTMLHDRDKNLRVEEIATARHGCTLANLNLERFPETLLLAVRDPAGWVYNPPRDHMLAPQSCLIVMTTPEERRESEAEFAAKTAS